MGLRVGVASGGRPPVRSLSRGSGASPSHVGPIATVNGEVTAKPDSTLGLISGGSVPQCRRGGLSRPPT